MSTGAGFKPKMLGFLCNWCCYAGADLCGVSRFQYPPHIRIIRLMCSGRVDLSFVLRAFAVGHDAVFIGGCWPGECHYITEGNYDALSMLHLARKILGHIGLDPNRLRLEWVSASEGIRFAEVMTDFSAIIKKLGPLGQAPGEIADPEERASRIEAVTRLIPYIKITNKKKLALHHDQEKVYENLYTTEEITKLFTEVTAYHIDPEKCQACMICARKCPVDAITGGKKQPHVIDQDKCIKCGTCLDVCPSRFAAVTTIISPPVPELLARQDRTTLGKGEVVRGG